MSKALKNGTKLNDTIDVVADFGADPTGVSDSTAAFNLATQATVAFSDALRKKQYFAVGYYKNPDVTVSGFSSWIAKDHPFAITYEATAIIFKTIGYDKQVPIYRGMVAEEMQRLVHHTTTGLGL
jgi:hypothetical protein